jgi:hypothetical protein
MSLVLLGSWVGSLFSPSKRTLFLVLHPFRKFLFFFFFFLRVIILLAVYTTHGLVSLKIVEI